MMVCTRQWKPCCLAVLMVYLCYCRSVLSINCNVTININSSNREGVFSSLTFPTSYPKLPEAYSCWFTLVSDDPNKYIQLTFDDFHLSSQYVPDSACDKEELDYISIYTGPTVTKYCGCWRPKMVLQDGGAVSLELHVQPARTDESVFRGFQARFRYLTLTDSQLRNLQDVHLYSAKPDVSNGYGSVSDPVAPLPAVVTSTIIDGLYYIEAAPDMRMRLTALIENATPNSGPVEIRDGLTSQATLLYNGSLERRVVVISSQASLYIRWRGVIQNKTVTLIMEFTAFKEPSSSDDCELGYFFCKNHRCINSLLTCDSRNNCGDGSDELQGSPTDVCHAKDACSPSPCLNGGTCTSPGPYCQCRFGYWGTFCQFVNNDCLSSPCLNGGTCLPHSYGPGFVCFCKTNRRGPYCQENVGSTCQTGQCNEGTCVEGKCDCRAKYFGDYCEFLANTTTTDYTDLQHTSIMIGAFVGAVCLLSICWLIAMARKRQTDEPVGRITRIVSVHSRDERSMRPSVTGGAIDLPPTYSDCVFDDAEATPPSKRIGHPAIISEENEEEPDGDVFVAEEERQAPPLSPPPTYESVAQSEDDGIVFEVQHLPDVVSPERTPSSQISLSDTAV